MSYAETYTRNAQECGRLAAKARTAGEMAAYTQKAAEWLLLAERDRTPPPARMTEPISFAPCNED